MNREKNLYFSGGFLYTLTKHFTHPAICTIAQHLVYTSYGKYG